MVRDTNVSSILGIQVDSLMSGEDAICSGET